MTPQDDLFRGPALASQWTFTDSPASGTPPGYSFISNPGNITIDVTALAKLLQAVIWTDYLIELGITEDNATSLNRSGGLIVQSGVSGTYIEFAKYLDAISGLPRLQARSFIADVPTVIDDIAYTPAANIVLRIVKHDGFFSFFYKQVSDAAFTQTAHTFAVSGSYSSAPGNSVGLIMRGNNTPNYNFLANHFFFRQMSDVVVNGLVRLAVTKNVAVRGDVALDVAVYPSVKNFIVKQYATEKINQISWDHGVIFGGLFTLRSPVGNLFDISVDDDGAFVTTPSTKTPRANPVVQANDYISYFILSVDNDGAVVVTPAPHATFSDSIMILLHTTPGGIPRLLYVEVDGPDFWVETIPAPFVYLGMTLVRNANRSPRDENDGEAILIDSSATSYLDGPIKGLSRYYYAAFAVYDI